MKYAHASVVMAEWLKPRLVENDIALIRGLWPVYGRYTPEMLEGVIDRHSGDFARYTEGAIVINRAKRRWSMAIAISEIWNSEGWIL